MRRLFSAFIATLTIFSLLMPSAMAFDYPDPADAADEILDSLGVDQNELRNSIQTFNVSRQKKQPPQVLLNFNPQNPTSGEKITVSAKPTYFLNDPSKLYYTWFIKHASSNKDLNSDGKTDIEDYKIEAMRIIASNDFDWEKESYSSDADSDGYKAFLGGDDQRDKDPDPEDHCYIHDFESGNEYKLSDCKHLFARAPGEKTGDNSFGSGEEKFWRTNPSNPDTAGTGNLDEATVAGMGMSEFTWNYQDGDKVGVVIEGVSNEPTQDADASYKIMWALPKNKCSLDDNLDSMESGITTDSTTETTTDPATGNVTEVFSVIVTTTTVDNINAIATITTETTSITTVYDEDGNIVSGPDTATTTTDEEINLFEMDADEINDCLTDNLVAPTEGGQAEKIDVSLSYLPNSPVNDPSGENADEIVINSSVLNIKNPNYLKYVWQVYQSNISNPESWGEPLLKSALPGADQTMGIGLSSFKFKLQFPSPPRFLKVKLTVTENNAGSATKEGHSDVIIPISSSSNKIKVYPVEVDDNLNLNLTTSKEICKGGMAGSTDALNNIICPVAQNELVGLQVSKGSLTNFLWTIDGEPIIYRDGNCSAGECVKETGENTNIAYFPILKDKGAKYTVGLTATDSTNGEKINLTKIFEVVDPEVHIVSADEKTCQPILLGNYIDLDGKLWPDKSESDYAGLVDSVITLKPSLDIPLVNNFSWFLDGVEMTRDNAEIFGANVADDGTLVFPTAKNTGEIYSVGIRGLYTQSNNSKKYLNKYWGVQLNEFYEKPIDDGITITMSDSFTQPESATAPGAKKILASMLPALPSYINFLFRIVMSTFLILAASWILFSFFPKANEE